MKHFTRFRRVNIGGPNISEILFCCRYRRQYLLRSRLPCHKRQYIWKQQISNAASDGVRSILKPYVAPRRFIVQQDDTGTFLQFGYGSEEDDTTGLVEPSKVAIRNAWQRDILLIARLIQHNYLSTNKLGVSPSGTKLTVVYKINDITSTNVPAKWC